MEDLKTLFYKVRRIKIPILAINPLILSIQVQLIHSEGHQKILWLPLFLIGILILHPQRRMTRRFADYAHRAWP